MKPSDLPANLKQHPDIAQWLRFSDSKALIFPGKVEIGQGIITALVQIASEELGLLPEQILAMPASTSTSPNEAVTSGSLSIQECGLAIRRVCALARLILINSTEIGSVNLSRADLGQLQLRQGRLYDSNGTELASYWGEPFASLLQGKNCLEKYCLDLWSESTKLITDTQASTTFKIILPKLLGEPFRSLPRIDFPAKFSGRPAFIQDIRFPNLRYCLVLRGAAKQEQISAVRHALASTKADVAGQSSPVFLEDGRFTALICTSLVQLARYQHMIDQAIGRRALFEHTEAFQPALVSNDWLETATSERSEVFRQGQLEEAASTAINKLDSDQSGRKFEAVFDKPWLSHGSIGLSCALACFRPGESMQVWTHSQGIFNLRSDLFLALGERTSLKEDQFIVQHVEGAGCYGHNGADDVAFDAARIALFCPGIVVRVQWSRAQELSCAPYSPAMRVKVSATLSGATPPEVQSWSHKIWSNGHSLRPGRAATSTLLGSSELEGGNEPRVSVNASAAMGYGAERNALPLYDFADVLIENYRLTEMPIRSSAFRGLGAIANVFAIESMMDEMARHLNEDPLAFRLRHLQSKIHERARAVLNRVALSSSWKDRHSKKEQSTGPETGETTGYGMAFARYKNTGAWCAVVAKLELQERVKVKQIWIAADVGRVVNEDGVRNQLEGAALQSTSIALLENARFATNPQVSPCWDDYPILKFSDTPVITIDLVNPRGDSKERSLKELSPKELPGEPSRELAETAMTSSDARFSEVSGADLPISFGAGEPATAPVVAAIANAVANALGMTIRSLPLTPETIASAIQSS